MRATWGLVLLLAADCPAEVEAPSYPQILVRALRAAQAGDPDAWSLCDQLEVGKGRGECRLEASRVVPDRGAACDAIVKAHWRNECWFEYAEDLGEQARWEEAVAACEQAEDYEGHCARHLWWTSLQAGTAEPALRDRLVRAFPEHDDEIRRAEADYQAVLEQMRRGDWTAPGQPAPSAGARDWERRFRGEGAVDPELCAGDATCLEVAQRVFADRWRRALERNPESRDTLCGDDAAPAIRLSTGGSPALEASLARIREEHCEGGSPG